jgi:hypothetical protein
MTDRGESTQSHGEQIAARAVRRRGMLAAVAALAAGGLAHKTARPALAGTDGDVVLGGNNVAAAQTRIEGTVAPPNFLFRLLNQDPTGTGLSVAVQFGTTAAHGTGIIGQGGGLNPGSAAGTVGGVGVAAFGGSNAQSDTTGGVGVAARGGDGNGQPTAGGGAAIVATGGQGGANGVQGVGIQATGGGPNGSKASGVVGLTNSNANPATSGENSGAGDGVFGNSTSGIGVHGVSNAQTAVFGNSLTGVGVRGDSQQGPGVIGASTVNNGVFGLSPGAGNGVYGQSSSGNGVLGQATGGGNGVQGLTTSGVGLFGSAGAGTGVFGTSGSGAGVAGSSANNNAVFGDASAAGNGVFARTVNGNGLVAQATGGGNAAQFFGNVIVNGNFTVMPGFAKSGAVTFADGTTRRLYAMESPESWFEDVGEAQLVNGRASVPIPPDFAQAVNTSAPYHVFPVAHTTDVEALAVTVRAPDHFEIEANGKGQVTGTFSYRILARRKGGTAPRFERVVGADSRAPLASDAALRLPTAPEPPKPPELPELPAGARQIRPVQPVPEPPAPPPALTR